VQRNKQQQQQHEAATATQAANNSINTNNQTENRAKVAVAFGHCPADHAPLASMTTLSPSAKSPFEPHFFDTFFGSLDN